MTGPGASVTAAALAASGLTLRRPTEADFAAVLATVQAAGIADSGAPSYTEQELRADWAERDLARDAWVVAAPDGRIVGYADVAARGADTVDADGYVHPAETGRGVGTALVRATDGWAADLLAASPDLPGVVVGNAVNGRNAAARALLEREGYAEARVFWRMEIELERPPEPPVWPAGIAVRPCATEADERAAFAVVDEAMRDHWGHAPEVFDAWARGRKARYGFDPALWHLAATGEEPVGAAISGYEGEVGWIRDLAVRRRGGGGVWAGRCCWPPSRSFTREAPGRLPSTSTRRAAPEQPACTRRPA